MSSSITMSQETTYNQDGTATVNITYYNEATQRSTVQTLTEGCPQKNYIQDALMFIGGVKIGAAIAKVGEGAAAKVTLEVSNSEAWH